MYMACFGCEVIRPWTYLTLRDCNWFRSFAFMTRYLWCVANLPWAPSTHALGENKSYQMSVRELAQVWFGQEIPGCLNSRPLMSQSRHPAGSTIDESVVYPISFRPTCFTGKVNPSIRMSNLAISLPGSLGQIHTFQALCSKERNGNLLLFMSGHQDDFEQNLSSSLCSHLRTSTIQELIQ